MKLIINLDQMNTKGKLLNYFVNLLPEMYSPNYDALIDTLTDFEAKLTIYFEDCESFENTDDLSEIFDIITKQNSNIIVYWTK